MKTPICSTDMKRGILCEECSKMLEIGMISELDVKVSRLLEKLSKQFYFGDVEFKKAVELEQAIVLVCVGKIGSVIGKKGRVVGQMSKELGKKVRVIEKSTDDKKMIQDLLGGVRVVGVNRIFRPDGQERKILIKKSDEDKLLAPKETIEHAVSDLMKVRAKIELV